MPARTKTNGATAAGRRRSTRISSTGKTSRYFEQDDVDAEEDEDAPAPRSAKAKKRAAAAAAEDSDEVDGAQFSDGSEDADEDAADSADDGPEEEEAAPPSRKRSRGRPAKATPNKKAKPSSRAVEDDDAEAPPPRKRGRPAKAAPKPAAKKQAKAASDDDESGEDESDDGNGITFEPAPQLRDAGGVEYEDTKLHPNTLAFLKDLKANNKRSWLKARDPEYRRSLKDWETFVETLTEKIIDVDETVPELPLKDVIFRIYRDIRFSKDPTPYKPHYSAAWSRTGRKGPYACYYVHCEPGHCFVGGGLWHPDKDALAKLRANIDERPRRLRHVLMDDRFRATFLPRAKADDEKSVLAEFAASNKENALKTKPQGFHPEHRDIELLKLRNYTVGKKLKDADLTSDDAQDKIMDVVSAMVDYVTFLNRVVMPDPGEDSSSDEEQEEENNSAGGEEDGDET